MSLQAMLAGAALTSGMIVTVGPQNLHLIHTGLMRRHVVATVAVCLAADVLFVCAALAGGSVALQARPRLASLLQVVAVPLLLALAWRSARDSRHAAAATTAPDSTPAGRCAALARAALVSFGNPLVWIETLLVVGAAGNAWPAADRAAFGAGALAASALWFSALAFGARAAAGWLARPMVLRGLGFASAALLVGLALRMLPDALARAPWA